MRTRMADGCDRPLTGEFVAPFVPRCGERLIWTLDEALDFSARVIINDACNPSHELGTFSTPVYLPNTEAIAQSLAFRTRILLQATCEGEA